MANPLARVASAAHFLGIGLGRAPAAGSTALATGTVAAPPARAEGDEEESGGASQAPANGGAEQGTQPAAKPKRRARPANDDDEDPDDDGDDDEDPDEDDDGDRERMAQAALIADAAHRQAAVLAVLDGARRRHLAQGRARENARCATIFAHPNAARSADFAARLAFNTRMPRTEALALMEAAPAGSGSLGTRMSGVSQPALGPGGTADTPPAVQIAASWDAAAKRAGIRV